MERKSTRTFVHLLIWAVAGVMAINAVAAEEGGQPKKKKKEGDPGKKVTLVGTVKAVKDEEGKLKSITLVVSEKEKYNVAKNPKGQKLAEEMNGKKVEVKGVLAKQKEKEILRVNSYKEVKAEEEADTGGAAPEENEEAPGLDEP
ncbi:MAG: hypothetical protein JXR37_03375 [Kiritimatiellae bacterium]|nr:hypothetical protein [Kiritimatiellia bacterium]